MSHPYAQHREVPANEITHNACCIIAENAAVLINQIDKILCWDRNATREQRELLTRAINAIEIARYRLNGNSDDIKHGII